ncbi:hypothetical protein [Pontibacter litorisediminis]|nr:hypothetical protein [Pontibacter litorisediminis]
MNKIQAGRLLLHRITYKEQLQKIFLRKLSTLYFTASFFRLQQ